MVVAYSILVSAPVPLGGTNWVFELIWTRLMGQDLGDLGTKGLGLGLDNIKLSAPDNDCTSSQWTASSMRTAAAMWTPSLSSAAAMPPSPARRRSTTGKRTGGEELCRLFLFWQTFSIRITFARNEGRKYLFFKKDHPRHFKDFYNVYNKATDHTIIEKRHTNFQGDACYGDAGMFCSLYFERFWWFILWVFPLAVLWNWQARVPSPSPKSQSQVPAPNPKRERGFWTLGCL